MKGFKVLLSCILLCGVVILTSPSSHASGDSTALLKGRIPTDLGGNSMEGIEALTDGELNTSTGYTMNAQSEITYEFEELYTITKYSLIGQYNLPTIELYRGDILVGTLKGASDTRELSNASRVVGVNRVVLKNSRTSSRLIPEAEIFGFPTGHDKFYENGLLSGKVPDEMTALPTNDIAVLTDGDTWTDLLLTSNSRYSYMLDGEYTITHYYFNAVSGNNLEFYNSEGSLVKVLGITTNASSSPFLAQNLSEDVSGVTRVDLVIRDLGQNHMRELNIWGEKISDGSTGGQEGEDDNQGVKGRSFNLKRGIQEHQDAFLIGNYGKPKITDFNSLLPYGYQTI